MYSREGNQCSLIKIPIYSNTEWNCFVIYNYHGQITNDSVEATSSARFAHAKHTHTHTLRHKQNVEWPVPCCRDSSKQMKFISIAGSRCHGTKEASE